jgi:hypothetical protein
MPDHCVQQAQRVEVNYCRGVQLWAIHAREIKARAVNPCQIQACSVNAAQSERTPTDGDGSHGGQEYCFHGDALYDWWSMLTLKLGLRV